MAYTELIKNFARIREYMRQFYVYGFRSREDYVEKSARSYDDERRRMESILGDYMGFRRTAEGKTVFLSIDSRAARHNPLYRALKAKSFTDGDVTLHFLLFDVLATPEIALSLAEITEAVDARLAAVDEPRTFDESTVRKKLKEYALEGLVTTEKVGKTVYYRRAADADLPPVDALDFFSEVSPCGILGSTLIDKTDEAGDRFAFKHHYITSALDSEILCDLFHAMREHREVALASRARKGGEFTADVIPLRIFVSVQNGRQYLMAYNKRQQRITSYRVDSMLSVTAGEISENFDSLRAMLTRMQAHLWGVSTGCEISRARMQTVSFTVRFAQNEEYIYRRLVREKRCGQVERLSPTSARFTAEVFDATELFPWMRTFLCRITEFTCTEKRIEERFFADVAAMYDLYGIGGDEQ